jgi:hypothetical protein
MSSLLLLVLLFILLAGCIYYMWISRVYLKKLFRKLVKGKKVQIDLQEKSIEELKELLSANRSLEHFEKCAEIRDEIERRLEYHSVD